MTIGGLLLASWFVDYGRGSGNEIRSMESPLSFEVPDLLAPRPNICAKDMSAKKSHKTMIVCALRIGLGLFFKSGEQ